jgi:hypothetical protein
MTLACSAFLRADTEVEWAKICTASQGNQMVVTTTTGETVQGFCTSINVDEMALRNDRKVIKIAKNTIAALRVHHVKSHRVSSLFKGLGREFKEGTSVLFSPLAPGGLVMLPGTVAWGAVATPFCLLGDGIDLLKRDYMIKVK